ncbi:MAG: xanthine dehydrogenase family protein molybdopterin-binding subunit, partial [Rubrimonas sp.]
MKFGIGQPVRRKEDTRFLTGRGRYVDDMAPAGAARAFVLRSPVAHARIVRADASAARAAPGVLLAWTGADVAGRLQPLTPGFVVQQDDGTPAAPVEQPHLALDRVRHVGEPVAFVVAETLAQARDAAELIAIEYEDLPAVVDPLAALEDGAPQLHDCAPGNRVYLWSLGDAAATDAAFAAAAHVTRLRVVNHRVVVAPLETRAIAARHDPETDRWEVWMGSQGAHGARGLVARALGVE